MQYAAVAMSDIVMNKGSSFNYSISEKEFNLFRELIYSKVGISLSPAKKTLVVSRLTKRLRHYNLENFSSYYELITSSNQEKEMQVTVDLLTTNETYFFREEKHFDYLQTEILPNHKAGKRLRVWSAACSYGQEPYTLAMVLADECGVSGNWEIIATDISSRVLAHARKGSYSMDEASKISRQRLNAYCLKGVRSQEGSLLIDKRLRKHIDFRSLNLINKWPDLEKFSVVFLRNVMIYFDVETKRKLVDRIYHLLEPGGYLFIGHSETLNQVSKKFKLVCPAVYQRGI